MNQPDLSLQASDQFLTPRGATLVLRAVDDPAREQRVQPGEPLLLTGRLGQGFVEVDFGGRRWLATEQALEPWPGGGPSPAPPSEPYRQRPYQPPYQGMGAPPAGVVSESHRGHVGGPASSRAIAGRGLLLLSGLLLALTPFLPWVGVRLFIVNASGNLLDLSHLDDTFAILLVVVFVAAAAAIGGAGLRLARTIPVAAVRAIGGVAGLLALVVAGVTVSKLSQPALSSGIVDLRAGFYLAIVAAVMAIAGGFIDTDS